MYVIRILYIYTLYVGMCVCLFTYLTVLPLMKFLTQPCTMLRVFCAV